MATAEGDRTNSSLRQLVDGFAALSEEYKRLSGKYHVLQNHISAVSQEFAQLRELYPDQPLLVSADERENKLQLELNQNVKSTQNLVECLEGVKGAEDAISYVRDAEFARFKLQTRLDDKYGPDRGFEALNRQPKHPNSANERDFTITRKPSTLQCPFVSPKVAKQGDYVCEADQKDRSSKPLANGTTEKAVDGSGNSATLDDPTHALQFEINAAAEDDSDEGGNGTACPIRFLDQQSPEAIAKYFEEHKHELPRSHEVCVKRFQANAESIRELDAKYGNLVSMIQGLGMKHQPMLPETPEQTGSAVHEEERKQNQKVKDWAKAVSDDQQPEAAEEERVSHFDRPLKEIRVGESPSRPWGVPIPHQYLDRTVTNESVPQSPKEVPPQLPDKTNETAEEKAAGSKAVEGKKPGKCPFDHTALTKGKPKDNVASKEPAINDAPIATKSMPPVDPLEGGDDGKSGKLHIMNKGLICIADATSLASTKLNNQGTLFIGYSMDEAERMVHGFS